MEAFKIYILNHYLNLNPLMCHETVTDHRNNNNRSNTQLQKTNDNDAKIDGKRDKTQQKSENKLHSEV